MATTTIGWGDGTSDVITVTYTGAVGGSSPSVSSSPNNTLSGRSKTIKFKSTGGVQLATLTITQNMRSREFNADFNNDFK
jgi:hypothetical protein